jgi:hypothetical protein
VTLKLEPGQYPCATHPNVDLTELVREKLDDGSDVAFAPRALRLAGRSSGKGFRVVVTCPGDGADKESRHQQACQGKYWP